jgi:hypothetical protein
MSTLRMYTRTAYTVHRDRTLQRRISPVAEPSGRATLTPTQSMILQLQRTAGNAAVNALLRQYASAGTAQPRSVLRTVTPIGRRGSTEAGNSGMHPGAQPAHARVPGSVKPEGTVIQRKLTIKNDDFKSLVTTKATLTNSRFAQITDAYGKYLKADRPAQEVVALNRVRSLATRWRLLSKSTKAGAKRQLVDKLIAEIKLELPIAEIKAHKQHLCEDIGLPKAYLDTCKDQDVSQLGEASKALGSGNVPLADQHLTVLRGNVGDVVNLIKSALLSHHIAKVDPEMAKVLGDPNYKLKKDDAKHKKNDVGKALAHVKDIAAKRALTADQEELKPFGKAYQDMAATAHGHRQSATNKKIKGLSSAEATAIFGYTTPLFGEYNSPLRKDLGTKKFGANQQALTKATVSGLNKLEPVTATLYRHTGLFAGYKELNQPGATVADMGFMSSTKSHFVAGNAGKEHDVLEIVESRTGREVAEMSKFTKEMEVLFKPATRFQITKRFDRVPGTENWHPVLDPEAAKYLAADSKKKQLQIIVFKKEM